MPQYQVVKKAFFGGKLYDPSGKRPVLTVDKPFTEKNIPSWVKPIKEAAPVKAKAKAKPRAKAKATATPKDEPSFMDGDASKSVETL